GHGPPHPPGAKHHTNVLARGPSSDGSMPRASLKGYGLARRWVKEIHERIPCLTRAGFSHLITGRRGHRAMRSPDRSQLSVGRHPLREQPSDEAGVELAADELRVADDPSQERDVGANPLDDHL